MVERVTSVTLTAQVAGYVRGFAQAESANRKVSKSAEDAKQKFEQQNQAMEQVGRGLTAFSAVAVAAVGIAVAKYTEFDKQMSAAQAATHETAENMNLLQLADQVFALPSSKDIKILAETSDAQNKINNLITLNNGRVVRISVQATNDSPASSWTGGVTKADGGLVDYYADGGMRENHIAEIAPAGAWRVWAEPETGGEAYIPLAPSKRARSLAVWEETGKRLQAFAAGGFNIPTTQPAAPYFSMPVQAAGYDGPQSVAFSFPSSGSQQKDMDQAMFMYRTKIRGGR